VALPLLVAYALMLSFEFPRVDAERKLGKFKSALRKLKTEAAGLRTTVENMALKINDFKTSGSSIDPELRDRLADLPARDQVAFRNFIDNPGFAAFLADLHHSTTLSRRIETLKSTWNTKSLSEKECVHALCENLWLLEPDLTTDGHIFLNQTVETIIEGYFPDDAPSQRIRNTSATRNRPSAAGVFYRHTHSKSPSDPGVPTLVVFIARKPGELVTTRVVDEAYTSALALRRGAPTMASWPVECWIIGGTVADDAITREHHTRAAADGIVLTPVTWASLVTKAENRKPQTVALQTICFDSDAPRQYHNDTNVSLSTVIEELQSNAA
jgi:hypothetical protein